jgi:hypothetical protein
MAKMMMRELSKMESSITMRKENLSGRLRVAVEMMLRRKMPNSLMKKVAVMQTTWKSLCKMMMKMRYGQ